MSQSGPKNFLRRVFEALNQAGVRYCILRDSERVDSFVEGGDVDLLVEADDLRAFTQIVTGLGLPQLRSIGYAPHRFFVGLDAANQQRVKLDVVTEIRLGKLIPTIATDLHHSCLQHRTQQDGLFVLSTEDELLTMLLHCMIDKGSFSMGRRARLRVLSYALSDIDYINSQLRRYWLPDMTWQQIADMIDDDAWDALLALREPLERRLRNHSSVTHLFLHTRGRLLRKFNRLLNSLSVLKARQAV